MKTALFIVLPFPSHYNACLGLMQARQREGYRVVVTATPTLLKYVTELGLESVEMPFVDIPFMQEKQIQNARIWLAVWIQSHLNKCFAQQRYRQFLFCVQAAQKIVEDIKPAQIYIDSTLGHYFFVLHQHQAHITLLNTRLSTRQLVGIPPYTVARIAKNTPLSRIRSSFDWVLYRVKGEIRRQLRYLALGKLNDQVVLGRFGQRQGLKRPIRWHRANMNYPLPVGATEWILCPQVFEYPWTGVNPNEQYVWFPSKESISDIPESLTNWLASVEPKERLIYCSLGTLSSHTPDITIPFLNLVLRAVSALPDTKLILVAGSVVKLLSGNIPKSVFLTDHVPQTAILPHCDAMITHGGMNTVKECICAGVPMLIYPLNANVEQPGNAARVVYHGLGLAGDVVCETEAGLQQKLFSLLQTLEFKQRVLSMQQYFQSEASLFYPMDLAKSQ